MKKYLKFLVLLAFCGAAIGAYLYNKPHKNIKSAKIDLEITSQKLFSSYEENEATANTKFLDKIIEVSGIVKSVKTDDTGTTSVTLESGNEMFGVICQMDHLSKHNRLDFKAGENIKLKGICTGMLMDVVLVRCVEI